MLEEVQKQSQKHSAKAVPNVALMATLRSGCMRRNGRIHINSKMCPGIRAIAPGNTSCANLGNTQLKMRSGSVISRLPAKPPLSSASRHSIWGVIFAANGRQHAMGNSIPAMVKAILLSRSPLLTHSINTNNGTQNTIWLKVVSRATPYARTLHKKVAGAETLSLASGPYQHVVHAHGLHNHG